MPVKDNVYSQLREGFQVSARSAHWPCAEGGEEKVMALEKQGSVDRHVHWLRYGTCSCTKCG